MFTKQCKLVTLCCVTILWLAQSNPALAQFKKPSLNGAGSPPGGANSLPGGFGGDLGLGGVPGVEKVTVRANFTKPDASGHSTLSITADIEPGAHIYSLTQGSGALATKLKITESEAFQLLGKFTPNPAPELKKAPGDPSSELQEHSGSVTWQAEIQIKPGVDPASIEIKGEVYAQCCTETSCDPPKNFAFSAKMFEASGNLAASDVAISGHIEPQEAAPGDTVKVIITAAPVPGNHIYALSDTVPLVGNKPTIIALTNTSGWKASKATESSKPIISKAADGQAVAYHEQPVSWTVELQIPKDAKAGDFSISGVIGYQVCSEKDCGLPQGARFEAFVPVRATRKAGENPLAFTPLKSYEVARSSLPPPSPSVWYILMFAFAGGTLLNLMPCVLPVIGLKLFSFIEQSGHSRGRILALNLWYTAGLLSVFMVLATLAVVANLGWGEQFSSTTFNVVMAAVVFVFALSFLGVWEIPIPGFVGSGKATELAAKEGAVGAFSKGILSTVLATPCSGPFLGPVFAFTVTQPAPIVFALFAAIGLGMASPYLLVGLFPALVRSLPKPGAWMDTFKQLMGFVLLGTVVFIFTYLNKDYVVPTFALLVGLWLGCWAIGRVPLTANLDKKLSGWLMGTALASCVGLFAFNFLTPQKQLIPWQPYSPALLAKLKEEGKTVMVDFTADWCLTCKANLKASINRQDVLNAIQANNVVPLLADWTSGSAEIKEALTGLNSRSIPILAFYPADKPNEPIILRDLISLQQVLDALKQAGPSKSNPAQTASDPGASHSAENFPLPGGLVR